VAPSQVLTQPLRQVGNELFLKYLPKTAKFFQEINAFWKMQTKGKVEMEFGHFYIMAINFPKAREVKAVPHVDGMNLAFGTCTILPIGDKTFSILLS
jgi:hypothetical protein